MKISRVIRQKGGWYLGHALLKPTVEYDSLVRLCFNQIERVDIHTTMRYHDNHIVHELGYEKD